MSEWLELESDPGLFTLLLKDFGVDGVQVEEIYDLSKPFDQNIYGFLFLFKWTERRTRRQRGYTTVNGESSNFVTDLNIINKIFFARQLTQNSCATHALLSILMNCDENLFDLGDYLNKFKSTCSGLTSEQKGMAIGNDVRLFEAHNSYAKPEPFKKPEKSSSCTISSNSTLQTNSNSEVFHYICFVPINNRLYELDGLQPYPIDHGPICESQEWTDKFKQVILERISNSTTSIGSNGMAGNGSSNGGIMQVNVNNCNQEIRYNLMALVPDRLKLNESYLRILLNNKAKLMSFIEENKDQLMGNGNSVSEQEGEQNTRQLRNRTISNTCLLDTNFYKIKINSKDGNEVLLNKNIIKSTDLNPNLMQSNIDIQIGDEVEMQQLGGCYSFSNKDLIELDKRLTNEITVYEAKCKEEIEKCKKYNMDAMRRKHKYDEFILTYVCMLIENDKLTKLIQEHMESVKNERSLAKKIKKK